MAAERRNRSLVHNPTVEQAGLGGQKATHVNFGTSPPEKLNLGCALGLNAVGCPKAKAPGGAAAAAAGVAVNANVDGVEGVANPNPDEAFVAGAAEKLKPFGSVGWPNAVNGVSAGLAAWPKTNGVAEKDGAAVLVATPKPVAGAGAFEDEKTRDAGAATATEPKPGGLALLRLVPNVWLFGAGSTGQVDLDCVIVPNAKTALGADVVKGLAAVVVVLAVVAKKLFEAVVDSVPANKLAAGLSELDVAKKLLVGVVVLVNGFVLGVTAVVVNKLLVAAAVVALDRFVVGAPKPEPGFAEDVPNANRLFGAVIVVIGPLVFTAP